LKKRAEQVLRAEQEVKGVGYRRRGRGTGESANNVCTYE
jgi:hypothetical protein